MKKEITKITKSKKYDAVNVEIGSAEVKVQRTGDTMWIAVYGSAIKEIKLSCYPQNEHALRVHRIK